MITIEAVLAMAIRDRVVLDQVGEALRSELCIADPYYRKIAAFADDFVLQHRKLPDTGDWDLWLDSLAPGMERDGTREHLGRLWAVDVSRYTSQYFATEVHAQLQTAAVNVARARLTSVADVPVEAFRKLADEIDRIRVGGIQGLVRLADIDVWMRPPSEQDWRPTGFPSMDKEIRGWGDELWIFFADSGVGKSMFLQNCAANLARSGERGVHITLELGLRQQIYRYYRQLAQASRADFASDIDSVKKNLQHWFKFAQGEIFLLEFPALSLDPDTLKRTLDRLMRTVGELDFVVLDYLDLLTLPKGMRSGRGYDDLGVITHQLRSVCTLFEMLVLTASQAVRRPEKAGRLTVRDMGDSYNKVRGADGLGALNQTPEEEEMFQGRFEFLKVRDSGGRGKEVPLYINRELALIQELDHPNTKELMRRLGHLPVTPAQAGVGGKLISQK